MTTALYRISSNEVLKISPKDQPFSDRDTNVFGVLNDPTLPDGMVVREELPDGTLGPLRVFGFAKIAEPLANIVRNALQVEIDTFEASQQDDDSQLDADRAADMGDSHPLWRKLIKAILKGVVRENNIMASRYNDMRGEILSAVSLADLQARITANTQNAPTRTNQQAFDAIRNDVTKGD